MRSYINISKNNFENVSENISKNVLENVSKNVPENVSFPRTFLAYSEDHLTPPLIAPISSASVHHTHTCYKTIAK